jgi:hypothetical protein
MTSTSPLKSFISQVAADVQLIVAPIPVHSMVEPEKDIEVLINLISRREVILKCCNDAYFKEEIRGIPFNIHVAVGSEAADYWNMKAGSRILMKNTHVISRYMPPQMYREKS